MNITISIVEVGNGFLFATNAALLNDYAGSDAWADALHYPTLEALAADGPKLIQAAAWCAEFADQESKAQRDREEKTLGALRRSAEAPDGPHGHRIARGRSSALPPTETGPRLTLVAALKRIEAGDADAVLKPPVEAR
jgi:hypothetical protein